jgi:hypothetical protein
LINLTLSIRRFMIRKLSSSFIANFLHIGHRQRSGAFMSFTRKLEGTQKLYTHLCLMAVIANSGQSASHIAWESMSLRWAASDWRGDNDEDVRSARADDALLEILIHYGSH